MLHGFVPVVGMGQMVNGNSGGPRISNVEIKGPLSHDRRQRHARAAASCWSASRRTPREETPCARQILGTLAKRAYRRPVTDADLAGPMAFYEEGRKQGTFDDGIQKGVMAMLASPKFLYRVSYAAGRYAAGPGLRSSTTWTWRRAFPISCGARRLTRR